MPDGIEKTINVQPQLRLEVEDTGCIVLVVPHSWPPPDRPDINPDHRITLSNVRSFIDALDLSKIWRDAFLESHERERALRDGGQDTALSLDEAHRRQAEVLTVVDVSALVYILNHAAELIRNTSVTDPAPVEAAWLMAFAWKLVGDTIREKGIEAVGELAEGLRS